MLSHPIPHLVVPPAPFNYLSFVFCWNVMTFLSLDFMKDKVFFSFCFFLYDLQRFQCTPTATMASERRSYKPEKQVGGKQHTTLLSIVKGGNKDWIPQTPKGILNETTAGRSKWLCRNINKASAQKCCNIELPRTHWCLKLWTKVTNESRGPMPCSGRHECLVRTKWKEWKKQSHSF